MLGGCYSKGRCYKVGLQDHHRRTLYMRNIFLTGLSGSGKSTVGCILAQRLNKPFMDTDALVEVACGASIPSIFSQHGADYFRDCETRALTPAVPPNDTPPIPPPASIF